LTDEIIRLAHSLLAIGCFSGDAQAVDINCASEMGVYFSSSLYFSSHQCLFLFAFLKND